MTGRDCDYDDDDVDDEDEWEVDDAGVAGQYVLCVLYDWCKQMMMMMMMMMASGRQLKRRKEKEEEFAEEVEQWLDNWVVQRNRQTQRIVM